LQAQNLYPLARGLLNQDHMLLNHGFFDLGERAIRPQRIACLNKATADNSRHRENLGLRQTIAESAMVVAVALSDDPAPRSADASL
jgi:hypothetical protein